MAVIFQLDELVSDLYWLFYYILWVGFPIFSLCVAGYRLYNYFKNRDYYPMDRHPTGHRSSTYGRGAGSKSQLEEIYERLGIVEGEIRDLRMQLGLSQSGKSKQDSLSQQTNQRTEITSTTNQPKLQSHNKRTGGHIGSSQHYTPEDPLEALCRLYNQGVDDPSLRSEFKDRYRPERIGTANAMARRRDPNLDAEFQLANDGDYYAITEVMQGYRFYAVVPKFDLTLQESNYGPGAMSVVFECPNYDPQFNYRRVQVIKPATFERDASQNWRLKTKGELDLGQGERS